MSTPENEGAVSRRKFMQAGISAGAGAAAMGFSSLALAGGRWHEDNDHRGHGHDHGNKHCGFDADYGPLKPTKDKCTGLYLLSLPEGFEYCSYGWTGQIMDDGRFTPTDHDGMAVVDRRGHTIALVRNHELSRGEGHQCLVAGGMYNPDEFGGTTNLFFDLREGKFTKSYTSLGGTIRNCAGGPTPWGTWVSCEETYDSDYVADGFNHGYVFDVPGFGISDGQPIRSAGRFSHEAVAVDPRTGIMYETEDAGSSAFFAYVQPGAGRRNWKRSRIDRLRDGGELYAMVVDGVSRKDMTGSFDIGAEFHVSWQKVDDPDAKTARCYDQADRAATFSRGEGCWEDNGIIYFVSTDGGDEGLGQVWGLDPLRDTLTLVYESRNPGDVDGPDNIAVSPRGGIILCEDGDSNPKRMVGLSQWGQIFPFAENRIMLGNGDIDAIDAVYPGTKANFTDRVTGDYRGQEWAGATFYKDWLFANIQSPGVTFAITGPWKKGAL